MDPSLQEILFYALLVSICLIMIGFALGYFMGYWRGRRNSAEEMLSRLPTPRGVTFVERA